jgi:hypothetical protein
VVKCQCIDAFPEVNRNRVDHESMDVVGYILGADQCTLLAVEALEHRESLSQDAGECLVLALRDLEYPNAFAL